MPELFDIPAVEIFAAGQWNGDKYTKKDLESMVEAFAKTKSAIKPYLKLGHTDKQKLAQSDGLPALGWIDRLYIVGEKLLADFVKIPKKIYELISTGAYRRVSSEIFINIDIGGEKYPRVLKAVALLGGDTPAVSTLDDIINLYNLGEASEAYSDNWEAKSYELDQNFDTNNLKGDSQMTELEKLTAEKAEVEKKFGEVAAKVAELETKNADLGKQIGEAKLSLDEATKKVELLTADLSKNEAIIKEHKTKAITADVNAVIDKLINEKKVMPAQREQFFTLLFELRTAQGEIKKYKIGQEEKSLEDLVLGIVNAHEFTVNTDGKTATGDASKKDDNSDLAYKAKKYAEDNKVDYKTALKAVSPSKEK